MRFPLRHIIFEITHDCNLRCKYCYNHWWQTEYQCAVSSYSICSKTLKKIFSAIDFEHISFTGGEPFLFDGLNELALFCRMRGKGVTVLSNGTVGKNDDYLMLKELGVTLFQIPLLSYSERTHNYLTAVQGSYQKSVQSIRFLVEQKIPVATIFVITRKNVKDLHSTLLFAQDIGVRLFMLARFNIGGRGIKYCHELLPSLSDLRTAFKKANRFSENHNIRITANVCTPFCIINPADYPNLRISACAVDIVRMPITIDYIGNMRICNHSPVVLGNIHTQSVDSILNTEYTKKWQTHQPSFCAHCAEWLNCRGGCRAASEQLGHSLPQEDPVIRLLLNEQKINSKA